MVRINLLNNNLVPQQAGTQVDVGDQELKRKALVNFVLILIIPALAYLYQDQRMGTLVSSRNKLQREAQEGTDQLTALKAEEDKVTALQDQIKKLNVQLDSYRGLARGRVREVQALDEIQGLIPPRTYVSNIRITPERVEMKGIAAVQEEIADFVRGLEESRIFSDVVLKGSMDMSMAGAAMKTFDIDLTFEGAATK